MTHIITGFYGSGKTEFAVNLALALAKKNSKGINSVARNLRVTEFESPVKPITLADLDVVNPFFRSREKEAMLKAHGVHLAGCHIENHLAQDLPAVSLAFLSNIRRGEDVIIDLAGGEGGLRLLAGCYDDMTDYQFYCVLNPYRPETDQVEKMMEMIHRLHQDSKLPITGLVNNGHMLAHTTPDHVLAAQEAINQVSAAVHIPVSYTLLREDIYQAIQASKDQITSQQVMTFSTPHMREAWQG